MAITVKELMEHLKTFDPDTKVVRVGHFGELHQMTKFNFCRVTEYEAGGVLSLHNAPVLAIEPPDIGPEPD